MYIGGHVRPFFPFITWSLIHLVPHLQQLYRLYTDASKDCVGATLAQQFSHAKCKGHFRPIAFTSRKMQSAETRYPIREQELLATVLALKQRFDLL